MLPFLSHVRLETIADAEKRRPGRSQIGEISPLRSGEGVLADLLGSIGLIAEDGGGADLLVNTPIVIEEIAKVADIGGKFKCVLLSGNVEIELFSELEVESVEPRSSYGISLHILAPVVLEILVTSEEVLVLGCHLRSGLPVGLVVSSRLENSERHLVHLFVGRDVNEL